MGLSSVRDYDGAIHCASVALGAESVSPLDMASAYGVFAARGSGPSPPRCCASPTATARCSSTTPSRRRPGCSRRTWPTTSPTSSRACSPTAPRRSRPRPTGRRQDGHHAEQPRRLVRRLHAHPLDGGVDRLREQDARDHQGAVATSRASAGSPAAPTRPGIWQAFMRAALAGRADHRVQRAGADRGRARRGQAPGRGAASRPASGSSRPATPRAAATWRTPARRRPTRPPRPPPHAPLDRPRPRRPIPTSTTIAPRGGACSTERFGQPGWVLGSGQRMTSGHEVRIGTPKNTASGANPSGE